MLRKEADELAKEAARLRRQKHWTGATTVLASQMEYAAAALMVVVERIEGAASD
jgi:hypothetical protein